jgi:hypothetical protein
MRRCLWAFLFLSGVLAQQSSFEVGFEQRIRNENFNNILDYAGELDDEREQVRYRTRAWVRAPLGSSIDLFAGLNQETCQRMGKVNRFDEVLFESAYLDFKRLFVPGLALRVGRQNLTKGEGFLIFEGTPGDGSRSIYFNAADLSYSRGKTRLELIGILNPSRDRMLPRIHDQRKQLQDWDERALGLYVTENRWKNTAVEAYYFYKRETGDVRPRSNPQFQPDRYVHAAGGRVVERINPRWSVTAEWAREWGGQRPAAAISAYGGYAYLKRTFARPWTPYVQGGYWVFSGDDPSTPGTVEGWDPLFSRWPKWSELYLYSLAREGGAGYWSNLGMWQGEIGFTPRKPLGLRLTWYRMRAFHPYPGDPQVFGKGTGRGDNVQARFDFSAGRNWKGHVLYEAQLPGSFYARRGLGYFLRFELTYSIQASLVAQAVPRAQGRPNGLLH